MSRAFSGLCVLLVLLTTSEEAFCHRHGHGRHGHHHHRHGHHHRPAGPVVNLVIYDPKGLEVSVARPNSTAQYFAIQMTINNPSGTTPDVSLSTTDLVYGKFIVRDTEVILKPGDFINATYQVGFSDGGEMRYNTKRIVYNSMIQRNCSCKNDTPSKTITQRPMTVAPWLRRSTVPTTPPRFIPTTPAKTTTTTTEAIPDTWTEDQIDYSSELFDCEIDPTTNRCTSSSMIDERFSGSDHQPRAARLLQDERYPDLTTLRNVFEMVNGQCVSKPRTNFLTLKSPAQPLDTSDEVEAYVRTFFNQSPKLTVLADKGLKSARQTGKVIVFEMNTLINKLQLLYLAQEGGLTAVKDYD